jgi:hypothetical protein
MTEAEKKLRKAFDDAVESLVKELGKESGKGKDQREKARRSITKNEGIISAAEERISFLENALEEWQEFLDEPGTPTPKEYHLAWRNIFGESSGFVKGNKSQQWWDENSKAGGEADLVKAGDHFRAKVAEMEEQISDVQPGKISKAETQIVNAESAIASIEETLNKERGPAREARQAAIDLGENPSETDIVNWMVDSGFNTELDEIVGTDRKGAEGLNARTESFEGRLALRDLIADVREERAATEDFAKERFRRPSDVDLETEVETGPGAQGPPTNEITDITSDPMQIGLEEGLAAQRDRIEQARGQDRVTDPRQAVPEFGEFPITSGGGDGGTPLPETYQDELDAIADALGITGGFGANFFLDRDDMMITHPVTKEKVNILEYIMDEELTGGKEVEELLEQTQWWAETDRQMRAFDLEWNRLGDGTGIPNTSQLGYIQPTINTVKTQLNKLGVELDDKVVNAIAKSAARLQLTGRQLREHLSDLDGFEGFDFDALVASQEEGLLGTYRDDIQKEASKWMISLGDDIDAETMNNMIESFYEGGGTQDDIDMASTYFANQAKALYPTLAPIIDQGISLSTYFLPYKQRVQNLLERQIDFLGTDHGLFDKIISYTGAGEGIPRVATFSEIDRMIKSDRSSGYWETTQAANKSRSLADTVGRMFGAVA